VILVNDLFHYLFYDEPEFSYRVIIAMMSVNIK